MLLPQGIVGRYDVLSSHEGGSSVSSASGERRGSSEAPVPSICRVQTALITAASPTLPARFAQLETLSREDFSNAAQVSFIVQSSSLSSFLFVFLSLVFSSVLSVLPDRSDLCFCLMFVLRSLLHTLNCNENTQKTLIIPLLLPYV